MSVASRVIVVLTCDVCRRPLEAELPITAGTITDIRGAGGVAGSKTMRSIARRAGWRYLRRSGFIDLCPRCLASFCAGTITIPQEGSA